MHLINGTTHPFFTSESRPAWFSNRVSTYSSSFSVSHFTEELFDRYQVFFPPELKNAVIKRRAEFFAGRYCAQQSLISLIGNPSVIHIGPHRNPLWPAPVTGSISHTNNHAIAATALKSHARGIGIDIQDEIDSGTYASIKAQIVFGEEVELIEQYRQAAMQLLMFSLMFSVKESFFKAAFPEVGHYFDFSCVSVITIDQGDQCIYLKINETLNRHLTKGLTVKADYQCLPDKKVVTLVVLDP